MPNPSADIDIAFTIDARGLACPLPLLKAKLGLHQLPVGQCLQVLATDRGSVRDFQSFANLSGHSLLFFAEQNECFVYVLQKNIK